MEQAAFGIVDIQEFYDLETEDLIDGLLNDRNSDIVHKSIKKLTFPEIILISQAAGVSGYFDRKIEWLESAIPLAKSEDDLKNLKVEINIAKAEYNGDHIHEINETISFPEIQIIQRIPLPSTKTDFCGILEFFIVKSHGFTRKAKTEKSKND